MKNGKKQCQNCKRFFSPQGLGSHFKHCRKNIHYGQGIGLTEEDIRPENVRKPEPFGSTPFFAKTKREEKLVRVIQLLLEEL